MALQQINWLQIDTQRVPLDASGSASLVILGGTGSNYLEAVYAKNLYSSGSLTVGGDLDIPGNLVVSGNLTVKGTTTAIESNIVTIGDNIVELNGTSAAFGGLLVKDPTAPNTISGSLLWDTENDYWIGGPLGSEERIILQSDLDASSIWQETGSFYATTNDLQVTGSMIIKGNLRVEGTTTMVQVLDPNTESLIVSGAMSIVRNELTPQIVSASLSIQNLGSLSDRSLASVLDCGDGFF
jgi:cytoskeletal protein CcmA (bactofilin family)